MAQVAARPLTVHDYMELPEGPPQWQLIEGDLYMMPPPYGFHQDIAGNIFAILKLYLKKRPIGKVGIAPYGVFLMTSTPTNQTFSSLRKNANRFFPSVEWKALPIS